MSVIRCDGTSTVSASTAAHSFEAEISIELDSDIVEKPRLGLGSTANENIALRRNYREMELLWKTQKTLVEEEGYVLKLIELYEKSVQLKYKRLTKRVKKIKSHLTEEEIIEMENDLRKKEFADKYRLLLHNQEDSANAEKNPGQPDTGNDAMAENSPGKDANQKLEAIIEESHAASNDGNKNSLQDAHKRYKTVTSVYSTNDNKPKQHAAELLRSQSCQVSSTRTNSLSTKRRPETTPNSQPPEDNSEAIDDIIPSLEALLDNIHNIKPNQFYENQRKLKLYEIRLLEEELELKKEDLFKGVDQIINWDKKEEVKEESKEEEEKPRTRKTSFMRSVIRNFSMELMMKTMQYGWTDLGQCRYLRNRGGDGEEEESSGANTLAMDTMKIKLDHEMPANEEPQGGARGPEPGFDANGKMIRTADLLGLK